MFPTNYFPQKKLFILIGVLFLITLSILSLLIVSITNKPGSNVPFTTPTPIPDAVSTIQYTFIGDTTQEEVEKLPTIEKKEVLPDGTTRYSLKSPLISRKNEILTKDGSVIFERILVPESPSAKGYAKISEYKSRFGQPEQTIRGSRFYGELFSTLIYAKNGFTLIGNTRTDEVFEIQHFSPMSIEEYKRLYGNDIDEGTGHVL